MPTLSELAVLLGGIVEGSPGLKVEGVASLEEAGPGQITFVTDPRYASRLEKSGAAAVVLGPDVSSAISFNSARRLMDSLSSGLLLMTFS